MDGQQFSELLLQIQSSGEMLAGLLLALIVAVTWKG